MLASPPHRTSHIVFSHRIEAHSEGRGARAVLALRYLYRQIAAAVQLGNAAWISEAHPRAGSG